jgi:hypothetical protein
VCELNLEVWPQFDAYEQTVLNAGHWWPNKDFVMMSERPREIHRNRDGRLHHTNGLAIAYADGWGLWMINGTPVDEQIVMSPDTQTVKQIDAEKNQDVRSIRIDRFGWPRYIKESGAVARDERPNAIEGTLEALFRCRDGSQRLVVTCPTGRVFALGVPADVGTCEQAQRWLAGGKNLNIIAAT